MAAGEIRDELTREQSTLLTGYLAEYDGKALMRKGASAVEHAQLVAATRAKIGALGLEELSEREYYALMVGAAMATKAMQELIGMGASPDQAASVVNLGVAGLHTEDSQMHSRAATPSQKHENPITPYIDDLMNPNGIH